MIKVSVVIPFYSSEPGRLIKAVTSALNQSERAIEVIIVDDCSPVAAEQELISIDDARIKIIKHKHNSNGAIARNTGVNNAKGQFVAFLDYDDIWYDNKLEQQISFWHSLNNTNAVVYCKCKVIDGKREFNRPEREIEKNEQVGDYLFASQQIIQTSGIFLLASLAKAVPFHDLKRHQDYQFCLSLEEQGATFHCLNTVLYEFVQIPKLNDYHFSIQWLNSYSDYLSERAVVGFKKLVIMRSKISHKHYKSAFNYAVNNNFVSYFFKTIAIKIIKKIVLGK